MVLAPGARTEADDSKGRGGICADIPRNVGGLGYPSRSQIREIGSRASGRVSNALMRRSRAFAVKDVGAYEGQGTTDGLISDRESTRRF